MGTRIDRFDVYLSLLDEVSVKGNVPQRTANPRQRPLPHTVLLLLASFHFDEAERAINQALRIQPNNLVVLMCQGRLGNATRNPQIALKSFQRILALDPDFSPDPRVGLGLAFWQSGDVQKAKLAWRRALERVGFG
jgi:tetratricopeptide (TPR) repeat protein